MSGFLDFLFGGQSKMKPVPTMTPEQQALLKQLLGGLGGPMEAGIGNLMKILQGGDAAFKEYEAPMMRKFNEEIIPGIGERFAGMGAGAQSSSAFPQALSQASGSLTEALAAQRAGLQNQALSQLQGLLGMGLNAHPFQYAQSGGGGGLFGAMMPGIGMGMGQMGGSSLLNWLFGKK